MSKLIIPGDSQIQPDKLTLRQIVAALTAKQFVAVIGALVALVGGSFATGYRAQGDTMDRLNSEKNALGRETGSDQATLLIGFGCGTP